MDSEVLALCSVQIVLLLCVLGAILYFLGKHLAYRSKLDANGRTVLLTGCDGGLGFGLAVYFDKLGLRVIAGFSNTVSTAACRLKAEASDKLRVIQLDLATLDDKVAKVVEAAVPQREGGLWAVINAPTDCVQGNLDWQSFEYCQRQIEVNLNSAWKVSKVFSPLLKPRSGRIIFVGSITGSRGLPGLPVYSASAHGVEALSQALRHEYAESKVDVITVRPGGLECLGQRWMSETRHKHMNEMWDKMSVTQRKENEPFFVAYHNKMAKTVDNFDEEKTVSLPSYITDAFECAVLEKRPLSRYSAALSLEERIKRVVLKKVPFLSAYYVKKYYSENVLNACNSTVV